MARLSDDIIHFFQRQGYVIVSTIGKKDTPHNSCKGILKINKNGRIYLLDLYKAQTFANLKRHQRIAVTAVNEHKFKGFCLKGKARIVKGDSIRPGIIAAWEKRINQRITKRVLKNLTQEKGHPRHPEVLMPKPKYLIVMQVDEVVDLTPHHLK